MDRIELFLKYENPRHHHPVRVSSVHWATPEDRRFLNGGLDNAALIRLVHTVYLSLLLTFCGSVYCSVAYCFLSVEKARSSS